MYRQESSGLGSIRQVIHMLHSNVLTPSSFSNHLGKFTCLVWALCFFINPLCFSFHDLFLDWNIHTHIGIYVKVEKKNNTNPRCIRHPAIQPLAHSQPYFMYTPPMLHPQCRGILLNQIPDTDHFTFHGFSNVSHISLPFHFLHSTHSRKWFVTVKLRQHWRCTWSQRKI